MNSAQQTGLEDSAKGDQFPVGLLRFQGDLIIGLNAFAQSILGDEFSSVQSLIDRHPSLEIAIKRHIGVGVQWVSISGKTHGVMTQDLGDIRSLVILPNQFHQDPKDELLRLQQSLDDFVEIFENCFDGIYVADGEGTTEWLNTGFEQCYGVDAKDFIGRNVLHMEQQGYIDSLVTTQVIATKKPVTRMQRSHDEKHILATGIPILDKSGNVRRVIINARDITELLHLQQSLDIAKKDIARYESEISRLRSVDTDLDGLSWHGHKMETAMATAKRVAALDAPVWMTGESGVGKKSLAKFIHENRLQKSGSFYHLNCAALPEELLEKELFGQADENQSGVTKGQRGLMGLAESGTLYLENVDALSMHIQAKLLAVMEDSNQATNTDSKTCRIIASSMSDLRAQVSENKFLSDLYYRLSVAPIHVPPLRERPEEIRPMALKFLGEFNKKYGQNKQLSVTAIRRLVHHSWPGNVKELRSVVERLVVTVEGRAIEDEAIPSDIEFVAPDPSELTDFKSKVHAYEARLLTEAVSHFGSIRKAAQNLDISESTIKRKIKPRP